MLVAGEVGSVGELAERYGVDRSYVGRILKLGVLAPSIVEGVVVADEPNGLSLDRLKRPLPSEWGRQRATMGF